MDAYGLDTDPDAGRKRFNISVVLGQNLLPDDTDPDLEGKIIWIPRIEKAGRQDCVHMIARPSTNKDIKDRKTL